MKNSKKKTMRFYLTLAGIKVLIKVLQLCGKNATHVPGRIAINICPDFLDQIDNGSADVFCVEIQAGTVGCAGVCL